MTQAAVASTTRRALLTGAATASAAIATVALATPKRVQADADWDSFIQSLGTFAPDGRGQLAARHARAAGMDPRDLFMIALESWGAPDEPSMSPILMFKVRDGGKVRSFRPRGEDQ